MNAIWKFPLNNEETPIEAHVIEFLTVQMQNGQPCVWAIVDPDRPPKKYKICIIGTGWECRKIDASKYIGTVQDGMYVWHCFWEQEPAYKPVKETAFALFSSQPLRQERHASC